MTPHYAMGHRREGVSFTVIAKLRVAEKLDQFGIDYIEGGWPGSNPRDMAFFEKASGIKLNHSKIAAFGSTRRASAAVEDDPQIKLLLDANTPVVTIFGKSWFLHVTRCTKDYSRRKLVNDRRLGSLFKRTGQGSNL